MLGAGPVRYFVIHSLTMFGHVGKPDAKVCQSMADLDHPIVQTGDVTTPNITWQRIVFDLAKRIRSGETPVGSKIPSNRELAERYGASAGTVKRAVEYLRNDGALQGAQGSGVFVARVPPDEIDFSVTTLGEVTDKIARIEKAVASLESDRVDLREIVGLLQTHLIELYARLGQPYPHHGTEQQPQRRTRRRAAEG